MAAVVLKDGAQATPEELRAFLGQTFAKWQLPDAFVFVEAFPRTLWANLKRPRFANSSQIGTGISNRAVHFFS